MTATGIDSLASGSDTAERSRIAAPPAPGGAASDIEPDTTELGADPIASPEQPYLQSLFVWGAVTDMTFKAEAGPSPAIRFPKSGPYDQRLGYVALPSLIQRLTSHSFDVERQARQSPDLLDFIGAGGYAVYHEKFQAGIVLNDRRGEPLQAAPYPAAAYERFEQIPSILVDTLRFIEDRDLLDRKHPYRNPAVEWRRLALAAAGRVGGVLDRDLRRGGASTLATQIEEYRHSPAGRTEGVS